MAEGSEGLEWFVLSESGEELGPFNFRVVRAKLRIGMLGGGTLVWREGMEGWVPVAHVSLFRGCLKGYSDATAEADLVFFPSPGTTTTTTATKAKGSNGKGQFGPLQPQPRAAPQAPVAKIDEWFFVDENKQEAGPLTLAELESKYREGGLTGATWVWSQELQQEWGQIKDCTALGYLTAPPEPEEERDVNGHNVGLGDGYGGMEGRTRTPPHPLKAHLPTDSSSPFDHLNALASKLPPEPPAGYARRQKSSHPEDDDRLLASQEAQARLESEVKEWKSKFLEREGKLKKYKARAQTLQHELDVKEKQIVVLQEMVKKAREGGSGGGGGVGLENGKPEEQASELAAVRAQLRERELELKNVRESFSSNLSWFINGIDDGASLELMRNESSLAKSLKDLEM